MRAAVGVGVSLELASEHADACAGFIRRYGVLADIAPAAFISDDHWGTLLSPSARAQLDALSLDELKLMLMRPGALPAGAPAAPDTGHRISDVRAFFAEAAQCRLDGLAVTLDDLCAGSGSACGGDEWGAALRRHRELLAHKKAHEVGRVARAVQWLAAGCDGPVRVLDVGSGKAYLGSFLSVGLGIRTVSVEGSALVTQGAARRHANVARLFRGEQGEPHELRTAWLSDGAEQPPVEEEPQPRLGSPACVDAGDAETRVLLTGLHACGDLTTTAVGAFIARRDLWGLVCVGCCYHLMADGTFPTSRHLAQRGGLRLSRHARMLASKALERELRQPSGALAERALWRPMLTLLLRDSYGVDVRARSGELRVGKLAHKCKTWVAYARAALAQLGFDPEAAPEAELRALEAACMEQHLPRVHKLDVLRLALAPAVESAVAIDRLLRVLESGACAAAWLVRMFDPSESPRCLGLVCRR